MCKLSEQIERKFVDSVYIGDEWEIETDTGWENITHVHKTIEYDEWEIIIEGGNSLVCADDHVVFDENYNEIFVKDVKDGSYVMCESGPVKVSCVRKLDGSSNMFDITIDSDNHRYYTNGILSHNTTTAVVIILHYILFNERKSVALCANKGDSAREILDRIKIAYEALPKWIQQGVVVWNKGSVELENGCKVIAAATSSSAIRGKSCLTGDTRVCIEDGDNYYFVEIDKIINKSILRKTEGVNIVFYK